MRALVMGVGGMGHPVAWALKKLGAEVIVGDICEETLHKVATELDCEKTLSTIGEHDFVLAEEVDVVVSCVPYSVTGLVARECAAHNTHYCDLGGNPEVSANVQAMFKDSGCFTDLGLAPGLANIIAEYTVEHNENPEVVELMCGGLPVHPASTLKYNLVFHPKGLWNEFTGLCDVIEDGKHEQIPALSTVKNLGKFEAAPTKGGLSHTLQLMLDRNVKECSYQTIRYAGHYDYIKFLLFDCNLRHADGYSTFEKLISSACPPTTLDRVFLRIRVDDWVSESVIEADNDWTAMQKGTAFPTAAVAALMAQGKMNYGPVLNYSHIPLEEFIEMLYKVGGMPVKDMFAKRKGDIGYCFTDCLIF